MENVPSEKSQWQGDCFVFDDRVAVNHDLQKGQYDQCHACRYPITENDKQSQNYIAGVSCPRCYDLLSEEQKNRFREREKQVQLAKRRGESHIGSDSRAAAAENLKKKRAEKDTQRRLVKE